MPNMNNFRDQLNDQLFAGSEIANDDNDASKAFAATATVNSEKKEYKVPPKVFKKPDLNIDTDKAAGKTNSLVNSSTNQSHTAHKLNDITTTGNNTVKATNPLSLSTDKNIADMISSHSNFNMNLNSQTSENINNISFSEENANSVVYSENKDHEEINEKDKFKNANNNAISAFDNLSNPDKEGSVLNTSTAANNYMHKIEKTTKFATNSSKKSGIKPVPITNSPMLVNRSEKERDNQSQRSYKSEIKSAMTGKSTTKNNNNEDYYKQSTEENPTDDNINNNNLNASLTNLNTGLSSSELSKKLEKLKNEIKDLKQNKAAVETNYEIEVKKINSYKEEIDQLRKRLNEYKNKEIRENETMLNLEIQNLKNSLNYRQRENELLAKENGSLKAQLHNMQHYMKNMIEERKSEEKLREVEEPRSNEEGINYEGTTNEFVEQKVIYSVLEGNTPIENNTYVNTNKNSKMESDFIGVRLDNLDRDKDRDSEQREKIDFNVEEDINRERSGEIRNDVFNNDNIIIKDEVNHEKVEDLFDRDNVFDMVHVDKEEINVVKNESFGHQVSFDTLEETSVLEPVTVTPTIAHKFDPSKINKKPIIVAPTKTALPSKPPNVEEKKKSVQYSKDLFNEEAVDGVFSSPPVIKKPSPSQSHKAANQLNKAVPKDKNPFEDILNEDIFESIKPQARMNQQHNVTSNQANKVKIKIFKIK